MTRERTGECDALPVPDENDSEDDLQPDWDGWKDELSVEMLDWLQEGEKQSQGVHLVGSRGRRWWLQAYVQERGGTARRR